MRFLGALLLILHGCSGQGTPPPTNLVADIELAVHGGGSWKLSEALTRGPVLVDFWATWCAPCKIAMPHYQTLVEKYGDRGLQVVAISEDHPNAHGQITPFFEKAGLTFPTLLDPDRKVGAAYEVQVLPTSVLFDTTGRIVVRHVGYAQGQEKELETQILALLGGEE